MKDFVQIQEEYRILIVDDTRSIHDDFRKILVRAESAHDNLSKVENEILDLISSEEVQRSFSLDSAYQGASALIMARRATEESKPYALAFIDMQMPPGLNGLETALELMRSEPDLQIVICTAYSNYTWENMAARIGSSDRLLILKKPFEVMEVQQLAHALTEKWKLIQIARTKREDLAKLVVVRTQELRSEVREKKNLESQLRHAQRLESLGTLASGIAHDLNNCLAPIMMAVTLLRKFKHPDSEEILSIITQSAQRGRDMVKQILAFAGNVEGKRECFQIKHIIVELDKLLRQTFPSNIKITHLFEDEPQLILGDATQIHQVLLNFCVNARDAMPSGGTLELHVKNVTVSETEVSMHPHAKTGEYVVVSVRDTGEGIAPEIMEKMFDPFFTTKEVGKGSGLGLSMAMGIVRSHGGFIRVRSKPQSTCFEVFLPSTAKMTSMAPAECPAPLLGGTGKLILVIDDELTFRDILEQALTSSGYKVLTASDGEEGLKLFLKWEHKLAAVLSDMRMPELEGAAMIERLKAVNPNIPIIGMSGSEHEALKLLRADHLLDDSLEKPFPLEDLLSSLDKVLAPVLLPGEATLNQNA